MTVIVVTFQGKVVGMYVGSNATQDAMNQQLSLGPDAAFHTIIWKEQ